MSKDVIHRYLENWQDEVNSAAQYRALASAQSSEKLAKVFRNLAAMEEAHVGFWEDRLKRLGASVPARRPSWQSRVLIFIARHVNPQLVMPTIAAAEHADRNTYANLPETAHTGMANEERWHDRVLREVLRTDREGLEGHALGRIEGRHRAVGGNALRAGVLGANDGLCSNLSLVMGVAGASTNSELLLVSGIAGMLAGAFSMALGEYVSVMSARELAEREIRIESEELKANPKAEGEELQLIYEAKGFSEKEAREMAQHLLSDPARALEALTREELGIDPNALGGSPWEAAAYSFVLFALGACVPVVPFLFAEGKEAVVASLVASALALFFVGAAITIFTGRSVLFSGMRQLLLGLAAAGITYAIGSLVGIAIA